MFDRNYYVICDDNCKFEAMTKEQILAAIAEATGATVTDIDAAFISKVKEQNKGGVLKFWRGTVAEFNALTELDPDCYYIKTNDTTLADINAKFETIDEQIKGTSEAINAVAKTTNETLEIVSGNSETYIQRSVEAPYVINSANERFAKVNNVWQFIANINISPDHETKYVGTHHFEIVPNQNFKGFKAPDNFILGTISAVGVDGESKDGIPCFCTFSNNEMRVVADFELEFTIDYIDIFFNATYIL